MKFGKSRIKSNKDNEWTIQHLPIEINSYVDNIRLRTNKKEAIESQTIEVDGFKKQFRLRSNKETLVSNEMNGGIYE